MSSMKITDATDVSRKETGEVPDFDTELEDLKFPDEDVSRDPDRDIEFSDELLDDLEFDTDLEDLKFPDEEDSKAPGQNPETSGKDEPNEQGGPEKSGKDEPNERGGQEEARQLQSRENLPENDDVKQTWDDLKETDEDGNVVYRLDCEKNSDLLNKELPPDATIIIKNPRTGQTYTIRTDSLGRVVEQKVDKLEKTEDADRNRYQQRNCPKIKDGLETDDGGHLVATEFGGATEQFNLLPMDKYVNRYGEWRNMEKTIEKAIKEGKEVTDFTVQPIYEGDSKRPIGYEVSYKVDGQEVKVYVDNTPRPQSAAA